MKHLTSWMNTACTALMMMVTTSTAWANDGLQVTNSWARATVPGQMATGAFMQISAPQGAQLLGVESTVGLSQIHQMAMENGVMRMSEVQGGLPIAAGQSLTLKPGGYHIMLMDLKAPLRAGSTVPLTLLFKNAKGEAQRMELQVPVRTSPPAGAAAGAMHQH
jgi:copper(I)-binding protein